MVQALTGTGNLTTAAASAATTITISKPTNTADGDYLVAAVWGRNNTAVYSAPPSGWTAVAPSGTEVTAVGVLRVYYKYIPSASAETATTYTWSGGTSGRITAIMFRVTGANTSSILDVAGAHGTAVDTTFVSDSLTLPAVSPTGSNDLLLSFTCASITTGGTRGAYAPPGTMTVVGTSGTATGAAESDMGVAQQILSASGTTGTRVHTRSAATSAGFGYMVTFKAAAAALTATLDVTPTSGTVPFGVTATAAYAGGTGTPVTYAFDWGDGAVTAAQSSNTATHTYTVANTYTVEVTVVNT